MGGKSVGDNKWRGTTNTKDIFKKSYGNSLAIEASGNTHTHI